jgi:hypothetical protein
MWHPMPWDSNKCQCAYHRQCFTEKLRPNGEPQEPTHDPQRPNPRATATQQRGHKGSCRDDELASELSADRIQEFHIYLTHHSPKVSQHLQAAVCENSIVKMDRSLRSRSASTARDEKSASVTSNIAPQESVPDNELERDVRNVERDNQNAVGLSNNNNVTSDSDESLVSANQLQSMLPRSWQTCRHRTQNCPPT